MHLMSLLYNYTALKRVSLLVIKNMYTPQELIRVSSHETPRSSQNEELQAIYQETLFRVVALNEGRKRGE